MKKNLDKILIVIGSLIILWALTMKLVTQYREEKLIEQYRTRMVTLNTEEYEKEAGNNSMDDVLEENNDENNYQNNDENIIGIIEIPKIELTAPIGEGTDTETLKYSVGHFEKTATPDKKGNCCIIGHRSYTYGEFFNRLDEIKNGDEINIEYNNKTYNYIVTDTFVVEPQEISVLEDDKNIDHQITLITCTPLRIGTHRLIIKGKLQNIT